MKEEPVFNNYTEKQKHYRKLSKKTTLFHESRKPVYKTHYIARTYVKPKGDKKYE